MSKSATTLKKTVATLIVLGAVAASEVACGGGGSVTGSSGSKVPSVAGNYGGSVTMTFPELGQSVACPASTSVTQSGEAVNIAPIVLGGDCGGMSIPFGAVTIDSTGNILGSSTTSVNDPSCGIYQAVGSGGFFGRDLKVSMVATSSTCWNFTFNATLTRQ